MKHVTDKPLAAPGLKSYRYKSQYGGWIMIGAYDHADALREAGRSGVTPTMANLQVWNGSAYEDCDMSSAGEQ